MPAAIQQIIFAQGMQVQKAYLQNVAISVKIAVLPVGIPIQYIISIQVVHYSFWLLEY